MIFCRIFGNIPASLGKSKKKLPQASESSMPRMSFLKIKSFKFNFKKITQINDLMMLLMKDRPFLISKEIFTHKEGNLAFSQVLKSRFLNMNFHVQT